jgi:shikimate dehydrogenase
MHLSSSSSNAARTVATAQTTMTATLIKLSLLGANIQKTRFPRLLETLCRHEGLRLEFDLSDSTLQDDFDFDRRVDECAASGYCGIAVTHPFKTRAVARAGELRDMPPKLGAANSLLFEPGGWIATNTDYTGLLKAWAIEMGGTRPGRVAMAGAGGVARSIAFALVNLDCERIDIFDVVPERAQAVADAYDPAGDIVHAVDAGNFRDAVVQADGLVNATPLGMVQYPGMAFEPDAIGPQQWAFDAVYTPIETPFMRAAERRGLQRLTGFQLFLHMGIDSFEFFSGRTVDRETVLPDLRHLAPES